ncbi:unnamed protein product [Ophioblennius macclurei]
MTSAGCFRDFLTERLSAAAEEIFRVFEQTVLEYQEEISRQRRLLDMVTQPHIRLQHKDIVQFSVVSEESPVDEQNLCDQDGASGLDLNDLDVSQIKVEEELWTSLEEEQNVQSQETYLSELNLTGKGRDNDEDLSRLLESQEGDEEKLHIDASVGTIKTEYDCEDSGLPLQKWHRNIGTQSGGKPFCCDTCGKSFSKMQLLKKHMIIHTGLKPFVCDVCGKKFNSPSSRDAHKKTHSSEKPHACDFCGKAFSRSADLRRHSRSHTGEKPYSCSFCGQVFPYHTSLKNHLRRHTGEKPYRCMWCDKGFALKATMKIHTRVHTGEKPNKRSSGRNKNLVNDF